MISVLLADNQAIFRAGAARVLTSQQDIRVAAQCERPAELLPLLQGHNGSILIVAPALIGDVEELAELTAAQDIRVVLMKDELDEPPVSLMRRARGLISRHTSTEDLLLCVRRIADGERFVQVPGDTPEDTVGRRIRDSLSPRELQIMAYIVQGWKNRQIADEIGTKEQVVKNYLRSIYDKTGASDRLELALFTLHHRVLAEAAARTIESTAVTDR